MVHPGQKLIYLSDPPSLLANSELRDISLRPSTISNARITIIHPQLRDLILPVERGRVLYPRGNGIEEVRWKSEYHEERKEEQGEDVPQKVVRKSPMYPPTQSHLTFACRYQGLLSLSSG